MTITLIGITLIYLFIIGRFVLGFDKVEDFELNNIEPKTSFTIVVPFRNEAENLPNLIQSLSELNYPKFLFEIILVDDDSEDDSVTIIKNIINNKLLDGVYAEHSRSTQGNITIIKNIRASESPKKDALTAAIKKSKHNWILTTDADCTFNKEWLSIIDAFIQEKQPKMVVGPVTYKIKKTFLERFQLLDFISLIGATIGGFGIGKPFLCNGANLCYSKDTFNNLNGFEGNNSIASGDDIFLMEKILQKHPKDVHFLKHKNAIVTTKPQESLSQLISQRKRWAAKTSSYSNPFGKLIGAIVLIMNFSILAATFLGLFGVFSFKMIGYVFLIKFCIDLWLIYKTSYFFNKTKHLSSYALSSLLYPFFNVYIAITSWYSGYSWKGRKFNK